MWSYTHIFTITISGLNMQLNGQKQFKISCKIEKVLLWTPPPSPLEMNVLPCPPQPPLPTK